ncbi:MAG: Hexitol phosphatase B [Candidatus Erwinia impunctatus]|nr:Hexitol phosphatase B [Culicoides impunctatus]
MSATNPVSAVIFDMDGLLNDSEPFWYQAEQEIFSSHGFDLSRRNELTDTTGLRIDQVVKMWYDLLVGQGGDQQTITQQFIHRTLELVESKKPLLPGVIHALELCRQLGLKMGLASASPLFMIERVLQLFAIRQYFDVIASAETLPWSKPHPQVYLNAAAGLAVEPVNCVALEDSINGMIASKAARMRSIVIPDAAHSNDPRWSLANVRLSSLDELTGYHLLGE